jgi:mono/diheme cytochrome c family protein
MRYKTWLAFLVFFLPGACLASGADPYLSFVQAGGTAKTLSLAQMKARLPMSELDFFDPEYGKQKRYRGFALARVLDLAFGPGWQGHDYTEMIFSALDGYASVSTLEKLNEPGGFIVFEDRDKPGWEPVGRSQANPGPFYLVWTNPAQSTANEYPWPWQLAKLELVRFKDRYPEVYPRGVGSASSVYSGFLTFKGRCMRCHAMNQQGGKVGPDLNAPQSITEYRSPLMLKAFIRQPSQFRYTHMPDHADLTDADLNNLLDYFRHMANQRKQSPR